MTHLAVHNRQRRRRIRTPLLRSLARHVLETHLQRPRHDIAIHLVGARTITRLNHRFLGHTGSTDIITFDYTADHPDGTLAGELFISIDDTVAQARTFGTRWTTELARYVIHGLLHLAGYDDLEPRARRRMKAVENRLVRQVARRFPLSRLSPPPTVRA